MFSESLSKRFYDHYWQCVLVIRRRKRFDIHLLTKMSDMTRRFEVIMTSLSSDKRNGQVQILKLSGCLYRQPTN